MRKITILLIAFVGLLLLTGCQKISGAKNNETDEGVSYVDVENKNSTEPSNPAKVEKGTDGSTGVDQERSRTIRSQADLSDKEAGSSASNPVIITEGDVFKINLDASDPDEDDVEYFFEKPLNEKGEWKTTVDDLGARVFKVGVSDGKINVTKEIYVKVVPKNRAPVLEKIEDMTVIAGDIITIEPKAYDPNGDNLSYSISGLTDKAIYKTTSEDIGENEVTITATDGDLSDTKFFNVIVKSAESANSAPMIEGLKDIIIKEGQSFTISPIITDANDDTVTVSYEGLENKSSYTASFDMAGEYDVKVIADDGVNKIVKVVHVTILDVNRAPELEIEFN